MGRNRGKGEFFFPERAVERHALGFAIALVDRALFVGAAAAAMHFLLDGAEHRGFRRSHKKISTPC
jgi:hypothetical protein